MVASSDDTGQAIQAGSESCHLYSTYLFDSFGLNFWTPTYTLAFWAGSFQSLRCGQEWKYWRLWIGDAQLHIGRPRVVSSRWHETRFCTGNACVCWEWTQPRRRCKLRWKVWITMEMGNWSNSSDISSSWMGRESWDFPSGVSSQKTAWGLMSSVASWSLDCLHGWKMIRWRFLQIASRSLTRKAWSWVVFPLAPSTLEGLGKMEDIGSCMIVGKKSSMFFSCEVQL